MNWHTHIHADPTVLVGKPLIRGTRLSVEFLLGLKAQGWSEAQILDSYPSLSAEALLAVFAYAAERLSEETVTPFPDGARG